MKRFNDSIASSEQALAICREVITPRDGGRALRNLGLAHRGLGDLDKAIHYFERALTVCREIGHRWGEGLGLQFLGLALLGSQGNGGGRSCLHEALEIFTELGAPQAEEVREVLEGTGLGSSEPAE